MPIKEIQGDILTPTNCGATLTLVCHQVNCRGIMGSGLARQIRDRYPEVYEAYLKKCNENALFGGKTSDLLGSVQYVSLLRKAGYVVANIFGQDQVGRDRCYTNYDALRQAFSQMAKKFPDAKVRIPYKFGCGLAGGDWGIVSKIIADELAGKVKQVEIWRLKGV